MRFLALRFGLSRETLAIFLLASCPTLAIADCHHVTGSWSSAQRRQAWQTAVPDLELLRLTPPESAATETGLEAMPQKLGAVGTSMPFPVEPGRRCPAGFKCGGKSGEQPAPTVPPTIPNDLLLSLAAKLSPPARFCQLEDARSQYSLELVWPILHPPRAN